MRLHHCYASYYILLQMEVYDNKSLYMCYNHGITGSAKKTLMGIPQGLYQTALLLQQDYQGLYPTCTYRTILDRPAYFTGYIEYGCLFHGISTPVYYTTIDVVYNFHDQYTARNQQELSAWYEQEQIICSWLNQPRLH